MRWLERLRSLPLRGKVVLTVIGAAIAALGASTYLTFRYWRVEAMAAAEQQALVAARSTQATLESALRLGRPEPARHSLARLQEDGTVTGARVFSSEGVVLLSSDRFEEGRRASTLWIPDASALPAQGVVRSDPEAAVVRAFVPLALPDPAVLEVELSVQATKTAMDRGARLGIGLLAVSLLAVALIVVTMLEREVVGPIQRIDVLLGADAGPRSARPGDELMGLERSVTRLLERGRRAEARAEHQAGLAEVGELAAEMAHEFKRPLASIRTAVEMLRQEYRLDEGGRETLEAVDHQLEHLHETMQDLFSLARPVRIEETPVALEDALDEALAEVAGLLDLSSLEVERVYGTAGMHVRGDPHRLRQAFLNVLTNAVEAMAGEGHLVVRTEPAGEDGVEVSIGDSGPGLEPEEVERILKPFYSTKPSGTGLGLPLVARIVAAHGGGLAIESEPGAGTTVRITLPLHAGAVEVSV